MVKGLDVFRDWFKGFEDCYTLIGGAACDLWMEDKGLGFRATKDLDVVLVYDGARPDFVSRLWDFIKEAGYEGYGAGEEPQNYYRFQKPKKDGFPSKLEICTKHPVNVPADVRILRIFGGEGVSSLSAILLEEDYFNLVRTCGLMINDVPTVTGACLIALKAKAWLNLSERKAKGETIDQGDIDKHRNDVFRLLMTVSPQDKIKLTPTVRGDLRRFIEQLPPDSADWQGIRGSLKSTSNLTLPPPAETIRSFREFFDLD